RGLPGHLAAGGGRRRRLAPRCALRHLALPHRAQPHRRPLARAPAPPRGAGGCGSTHAGARGPGYARSPPARAAARSQPAAGPGRAARRAARSGAAAAGAGAQPRTDRRDHGGRPRNREVAPALRHGQIAGRARRPRARGPGAGGSTMTRPTRDDALDPAERTLAEALARVTDARGPSLELDSRVLRAAREEAARRAQAPAATPHRSQRRRRNPAWLRGGALAATLVLAVGVAWQLRPQFDAPGREAGMAPEAADAGGQSFEKATPAAQVDGPDAARAAGAGAGPVDSATQTPSDPASADSAASTREVS